MILTVRNRYTGKLSQITCKSITFFKNGNVELAVVDKAGNLLTNRLLKITDWEWRHVST